MDNDKYDNLPLVNQNGLGDLPEDLKQERREPIDKDYDPRSIPPDIRRQTRLLEEAKKAPLKSPKGKAFTVSTYDARPPQAVDSYLYGYTTLLNPNSSAQLILDQDTESGYITVIKGIYFESEVFPSVTSGSPGTPPYTISLLVNDSVQEGLGDIWIPFGQWRDIYCVVGSSKNVKVVLTIPAWETTLLGGIRCSLYVNQLTPKEVSLPFEPTNMG